MCGNLHIMNINVPAGVGAPHSAHKYKTETEKISEA